eukprot:4507932-Amphidinium_carterae.1
MRTHHKAQTRIDASWDLDELILQQVLGEGGCSYFQEAWLRVAVPDSGGSIHRRQSTNPSTRARLSLQMSRRARKPAMPAKPSGTEKAIKKKQQSDADLQAAALAFLMKGGA